MKLSEMNTNQAADAILKITPELGIILQDQEFMTQITSGATTKENAIEYGIKKILYVIPALMGKYRENTFAILAAIYNKSIDDIAMQPIGKTIAMIKETVSDRDFLSFFTS